MTNSISVSPLSLGTILADITPELTDRPCNGLIFPEVQSVEHPLQARGIILQTPERTFLLLSLDLVGISHGSCDFLLNGLSEAFQIPVEHIALHSVHQHTAPMLDLDVVRTANSLDKDFQEKHLLYHQKILESLIPAIQKAKTNLQPVDQISATTATVSQVAGNRRVRKPDGSIAVRFSASKDPFLIEAPEGLIDPVLRTLTFLHNDTPVTQLHYYATHPQTYYGDGRVSWDLPGIARQQQEKESGIFQIYFTGCAGNVTLGKYNRGDSESRAILVQRLLTAMRESSNWQASDALKIPVSADTPITWSVLPIPFPVRFDEDFAPEIAHQVAGNPKHPIATRNRAAMSVHHHQWMEQKKFPLASKLQIGPLQMLHLPAEPFVEYQLLAQKLSAPGTFTTVAAYGNQCGPWYYGPDSIFEDNGGYEQTWSISGPGQKIHESIIHQLVGAPMSPSAD